MSSAFILVYTLFSLLTPAGHLQDDKMLGGEEVVRLKAEGPIHELRKSIKQDISASQSHDYHLPLSSGQYLRLNVECWGINVKATVYDSSGRLYKESVCHRRGKTLLSVIANFSAGYSLKISTPIISSIVGHYKITVEEVRKATSNDQSRLLAESAFEEAERLRTEQIAGTSLKTINKYEEARKYWRIAKDQHAEIQVLINIGRTHQAVSQFDRALVIYKEALTLCNIFHDLSAKVAVLNDIGSLQSYIGDNQEALANATQALKLSRLLSNQNEEAQALHILGDIYYGFGDLPKALKHYQEALQLCQQLKNYRGQAEVLACYGYAYLGTSDIPAAAKSFQNALSISTTTNDRHAQAIALRALGNLQTKFGENQQAFNLLFQALEILMTVEDPHLKATVLGGLAYSYKCAGEKRRALEYYEQALSIFKTLNHRWGIAESGMTIGEIYDAMGESEQALAHYQQALSLFRTLRMARWEGITLRNIGLVYDSQGNKPKALAYYRQSLELTHAGQDQRYEAYTLNYIGRIYEYNGNMMKALSHYQRALRLSHMAADLTGESLALSNLAHLERARGNLDKARAHIEAAIAITESLRTKLGSQDLRASYFASARQYYELYIDILMRLHEQRPNAQFNLLAFETSEKARARSLLESLREARTDIRQGVDPALLEQERKLQQQLNAKAEHQARLMASNQGAAAEALAKEITQITTQLDEVKARIRSSSAHYAALKQPQPLSLAEVQQRVLDDDTLLLEYALGDERSYLWAVTQTEVTSFVLPGRVEIEDAARRFYSLLTTGQMRPPAGMVFDQAGVVQTEAQIGLANETLSRLLLSPLASKLTYRRLLVVADGALQYIPFQALAVPNTGGNVQELLIFKHEVVNEPSASALALLLDGTAKRKPSPKTVAVLADPVFELNDPRLRAINTGQHNKADKPIELHQTLRDIGVSEGEIPRLFASREEAKAILSAAPWSSSFKATDFEASRATATSRDLSQYRIVHFATHGFLNNEHPELSGLVLSLVDRSGQPQDGFLRLHDIYNLQLPVDLVVLSACNTGLGKDVKGEGLIGLTRGFMYAGAASVVASLWRVDDEATAELMQCFYERMLKHGMPPATALRESQLAMLRQKRWRFPYHWAGFVIQGQYAMPTHSKFFQGGTSYYFLLSSIAIFLSFALILTWLRRKKWHH